MHSILVTLSVNVVIVGKSLTVEVYKCDDMKFYLATLSKNDHSRDLWLTKCVYHSVISQ